MSTTVTRRKTSDHQFTALALDNEVGRRRNNRAKVRKAKAEGIDPKTVKKAKAQSYILPELGEKDMAAIKDGKVVKVTFRTGRVVHVGLKTDDGTATAAA